MKSVLVLLFSTLTFCYHSQIFIKNQFSARLGFSYSIGYPIQSIGIQYHFSFLQDVVQVNMGGNFSFNGSHVGSRTRFFQFRQYIGLVGLFGNRVEVDRFINDGLLHQGQRNYAVGYNYIWYVDGVGSSQRSGGMSLHLDRVSFLLENDFFAGQGMDRFRTNDVLIGYWMEDYFFFIQSKLWTGDTNETFRNRTGYNQENGGYKNMQDRPYGRTSHGIVNAGVSTRLPYGNVASISLGIDSELVRHALQNKLMHDKIFLPSKWRNQNAHYPMLNEEGYPVFDSSERRADRFFLLTALNGSWSY